MKLISTTNIVRNHKNEPKGAGCDMREIWGD